MFFPAAEDEWDDKPFSPEDVAVLLRAASAAPSLYNSQPWRFTVVDREIGVFADPERVSPVADPDGRQQIIACAAAVLNLRLAVRHLGYQPLVSLWPSRDDPGHLATIRRGPSTDSGVAERRLYAQIQARHTHRQRLDERPIYPAARQAVRYAAAIEGAWLRPIAAADEVRDTIDLTIRAIRTQQSDPRINAEMWHWLSTDAGPQGMPLAAWRGAAFPVPGLDQRLEGDWHDEVARQLSTYPFFVLATPHDTATDWLVAGQALQRALLTATEFYIAASFFNQIVEVPALRVELAERLSLSACPQMILRLGYRVAGVDPATITGRRDLSDVIS